MFTFNSSISNGISFWIERAIQKNNLFVIMNAIGMNHLWNGALPSLREIAISIIRLGLLIIIVQISLLRNLNNKNSDLTLWIIKYLITLSIFCLFLLNKRQINIMVFSSIETQIENHLEDEKKKINLQQKNNMQMGRFLLINKKIVFIFEVWAQKLF